MFDVRSLAVKRKKNHVGASKKHGDKKVVVALGSVWSGEVVLRG